MRYRKLFAIPLVVVLAAFAFAQATPQDDLLPNQPAQHPALPTVTFQFEFPGTLPSHYALAVDRTGRAAYSSTSPQDENNGYATPNQKAAGEPYVSKFTISQPTVDHIFEIATRLKYFDGNFDYTKTRVANTGQKTLIYADPTRRFQTGYNWSQNQDVMELTRIFQNISATLEYDRKFQFEMKYQKLALDADLKQLQEAASRGNIAELQLLAPTLHRLAADSSVMHIVRKRAQDLLNAMPQ